MAAIDVVIEEKKEDSVDRQKVSYTLLQKCVFSSCFQQLKPGVFKLGSFKCFCVIFLVVMFVLVV